MKVVAMPRQLNPRSPDTKHVGEEPIWKTQPTDTRISAMSAAFNWYNYFYGKKEAKDMIAVYLESHGRKAEGRKIRTAPDNQIRLTTGWLCRMTMMGLELTKQEQEKLEGLIADSIAAKDNKQDEVVEDEAAAVPRPNIQDRLQEKVVECAGELEGVFDDFVAEGAKMSADYKPISLIRGKNVAPQKVGYIADIWKRKLEEFEAAAAGKDAQLTEAYAHLGKIKLRNFIKFAETVINDCNAYVQIKKVERKPRTAKAVSPEKQVAKFKYLKELPDLKLVSEHPTKLLARSEAWLFDEKKRKLIHVVADPHIGTFTVKNNSIIGFSTSETTQKTLRKPAEQIKALLAGGKPASRKYFKEIRATETPFNGRGTENLIILKTW